MSSSTTEEEWKEIHTQQVKPVFTVCKSVYNALKVQTICHSHFMGMFFVMQIDECDL